VSIAWIFLFSCSRHAAHCRQVLNFCLAQFRIRYLQWSITIKYRSLLLLFCALNSQIATWNDAVSKGMKGSLDENWICFNNGTNFRSRLSFRLQWKRVLQCCYKTKNIIKKKDI
jgi:hypothetical protein